MRFINMLFPSAASSRYLLESNSRTEFGNPVGQSVAALRYGFPGIIQKIQSILEVSGGEGVLCRGRWDTREGHFRRVREDLLWRMLVTGGSVERVKHRFGTLRTRVFV